MNADTVFAALREDADAELCLSPMKTLAIATSCVRNYCSCKQRDAYCRRGRHEKELQAGDRT